jgi:hypothetical protein
MPGLRFRSWDVSDYAILFDYLSYKDAVCHEDV